jgi:hypothetical protein
MKLLLNPEVLRRLAAVAGLFTALVFFFNPASRILKVEFPDFAHIQKHGFVSEKDGKLPLDQFIAKKVGGRLKEVSGPEWLPVVQNLLHHRQGQTPEDWQDNQPKRFKGKGREFYFSPDQEPFAQVAPKTGSVVYLLFHLDGQRHYILLNPKRPEDARDAPSNILYPLRSYVWLPLAVGLLIYFFVPGVKRPSESLGYLRLWGLVISDVMGLAFAGFFFALPLAMILKKGDGLPSLFDFQTGWAWLTIIMWLLTGFGLFMMAVGVWYRNFWIRFTPDGLVRHTHKGDQLYPYKDMDRASLRSKDHHWLVAMLLTLGARNPTAVGQAAILASQDHSGIRIDMKKAKSLWIRLEAFQEPKRLLQILKDNGVELSTDLDAMLGKQASS